MISIHKYLNILLIAFTTGLFFSCNAEDDMLERDMANVLLKLQIGGQDAPATRAAVVDALNENVIKSIDVFLYKKGADENADPVYYSTDIQVDAKGSATVSLSLPLNQFKVLFPTDADTQCEAYVIVNRPASAGGDNALPADKSMKSLKESTILYAPKLADRYENPTTHLYSPTKQDNFVMDGSATITRNNLALVGTIPVERVASKISLIIQGIADEVTDKNGTVWECVDGSARLSLRRGSVRTYLGSTPTEYIYPAADGDIFNIEAVSLDATIDEQVEVDGVSTTKTYMTTSVPFYTYPTNWKNDENSRTHFILAINWKKKNTEESPITTFYEVNVNVAGSYTQRNRHYKISQKIEVLGSEKPEDPVKLYPCSYTVLDWGNTMVGAQGTNSTATLSRFRYLVVDHTQIKLENVFSEEIFFFSSDPVKISEATVQWENIAGESSQTLTFATLANATITGDSMYVIENKTAVSGVANRIVKKSDTEDYRVTLKVHNANPDNPADRSYVYVEHHLDNSMDKEADYTEYTITLKLQHKNDANYNETIKITQYPMISIKAEPNSVPNNKGGVWVNKANNSNSSYGGVHGLGSSTSSNDNPNRYIISVSALNEGSKYIIGDPRERTVNNPITNSASAPTMKYPGDTNNRSLSYYYRTDETSTSVNMISPRFMIASSYGKTNPLSKGEARIRCATYQEDGYPAGRWRIPTQAEIEYIVTLSAYKIIPRLFGGPSGETTYWSASGAVTVNTTNNTVTSSTSTDNNPVRCVYDTWYWTDKCTKTEFTWGDKADF